MIAQHHPAAVQPQGVVQLAALTTFLKKDDNLAVVNFKEGTGYLYVKPLMPLPSKK
jgi:hypothetical protein